MIFMDSVIQVKGLTKVFRDFWLRPKVRAVDSLDLTVAPGEVFGLLGPNGSGKSTTIKILLGLLKSTSGTVNVFGKDPANVAVKHRIGYLPEESYLYNHLTPRETLEFYARLFDIPAPSRRERIDQLLEMVGLTQSEGRPVGEFSKGMARRVGLAQALINDPELIILDEPTSGLDPIACRQVKDLIITLAQQGKTIVLSSHLLSDVQDVCNRIAILYNGKLRASGSVDSLLEKQDKIQAVFTEPDNMSMDDLRESLGKIVGDDADISRPRLTLEQFFLNVVADAHRQSGVQSGASAKGGLAPYLNKSEKG